MMSLIDKFDQVLKNNSYKNKLLANRALELANLILISLVVSQIFNPKYRFGLALFGLVIVFALYLLVYLVIEWRHHDD